MGTIQATQQRTQSRNRGGNGYERNTRGRRDEDDMEETEGREENAVEDEFSEKPSIVMD